MITMVIATGVLTYLSKPEYTATATVLAKSQSSATPNLNFQDIATSNTLVLRVRNQLHLSEPVDSLVNRISVTGDKSNLFRVTVKDSEPDQAVRIANAVAQESAKLYKQLAAGTDTSAAQDLQAVQATYRAQYVAAAKAVLDFQAQHPDADKTKDTAIHAELIGRQLDQQATGAAYSSFEADVVKARIDESVNARNFEARVVDEAAPKPDTTGRYLKIVYAAALGLVLGIGVIFGLEYLDNSVREPEEAELLVGAPVIGLIPRGNARTLRLARGSA
jgi:capsular polysaccharide biosynthesis protein